MTEWIEALEKYSGVFSQMPRMCDYSNRLHITYSTHKEIQGYLHKRFARANTTINFPQSGMMSQIPHACD